MATITGLTAARMQEIEAASIVDGEVINGELILTKHDGTTINAGPVLGPAGPPGPQGSSAMPGEVKLWPSDNLPDPATFGDWAWANGDAFDIAEYPIAAANIAAAWKTAHGLADPGPGKFRVPDLRGLTPACLDALPVGAARTNRMTRAVALTIAGKTGEETHRLVVSEAPAHNHGGSVSVGGSISGWTDSQGYHNHGWSPYAPVGTNQNRNIRVDGSSAYSIITGIAEIQPAGAHTHNVGGSFSGSGGIATQGGDAPHENVQPTVFVPYIVYLG